MKKALISIICVCIILAAIFVALIIVPQYVGGEYSIETMPARLEYRLVSAINDAGQPYIKLDSDWDTAGLVVVKTNKMGQKQVIETKDYAVTFPSRIAAAGEYLMYVTIKDTDIKLPITINVLALEQK